MNETKMTLSAHAFAEAIYARTMTEALAHALLAARPNLREPFREALQAGLAALAERARTAQGEAASAVAAANTLAAGALAGLANPAPPGA